MLFSCKSVQNFSVVMKNEDKNTFYMKLNENMEHVGKRINIMHVEII